MSLAKRRFPGWLRLLELCLFAGLAAAPVTMAQDITPPSGTILINGAAATAASRSVSLTLNATDDESGVTDMSFSADGIAWTNPEPYAASRAYVLPPGNGLKTVWVTYVDGAGNASAPVSASITLNVPPVVVPGLRQTRAPDPLTLYRGGSTGVSVLGYVDDPAYDYVLFVTTLGDVRLRLYASQAPLTVANFLHYIQDGRYNDTFFHRSMPGFVVQGGGYLPDGQGGIQSVTPYGTVPNEFGPSNLRGTVAMAKVGGDPNSATCEWFFNLADNSANLDYQNGGFTAFGEVIPPGMDVVDAMAALPIVDLGGNFTDLPVKQAATDVTFNDLIYINSATVEPDELQFAVASAPAGVHATIQDGQLACAVDADAPLAGGPLVLNVAAFDGRTTTLTIPILVEDADTAAPIGTILINGGAATTNDPQVTLTLAASDDASGVVAMRFSADNAAWTGWQAYAVSLAVTLPGGIGLQTVYVQFEDGAGNVSASVSASITIASTVTGALVINAGAASTASRSVTLTLAATSTADSIYAMCFSYDGTTWTAWEAYATARPFVLTPGNGLRTVWVRFADAQWNESLPISATITLAEPLVRLPLPRQIKALSAVELYPGSSTELTLADYVDDPAYDRVLLKTSMGDVPLRLFTAQAPLSVANFLRYVDAKLYDGTFFHGAITNFILQGGAYSIDGTGTIQDVPSYGPIKNQFGISNTRGTIAMTKLSADPDSAAGEWLFNLADNSANLDYRNGGFAVFGEALDMTAVDAIAALPVVNAGDPFVNLPLKKYDGTNIYLADLITLISAARQPDELTFSVTGTVPGLNASVTSDGRLVIVSTAAQVAASGTFTLHAATPDGRVLDVPVSASVIPLVPPPPGAAPTMASLTFNHLAKGTPGTLRVYLDALGTNSPTQWSATGGVAPTGWIDVTGFTMNPATPTSLSFPIQIQIPATAGTRALVVILKNGNGLSSAAKSISVTVPAVTVSAATVKSVAGLIATLSVTATGTADEYAVMDGAWNAASALWQPISGGTVTSTSVTFSPTCALTPVVGKHTLSIAVRRSDLGVVSAARTTTTTLSGPAISTLKASGVTGVTANLSLTVTGGPTQYCIMENAWNTATAVWTTIPPGTIASGRLTFSANFATTPTVGKHTLYAAVRDPVTGLTSAAKSVTATVTGPAVSTVTTGSISGATATLAITVTGNPTQYAIMAGAWNAGTAVWQTIPPGTISSGRLTFAADFTITPATAGAHILYVAARDPVTGLTSAAKTFTATLAAPVLAALSSKGVAGTVVTLSIGVTGGPDQFAAMDGAWDASSAIWQAVPPGTVSRGRLTFTTAFALQPLAGAHTVYVAARNSLLNATSAPKSVTVTVAAPTITSMTPASGGAGRDVVTLAGTAFGPDAGAGGKVEFGGVPALIQSWSNTQIKCIVPAAAALGAVNLIVTTSAGLVSLPRVFTVLPFWLGAWTGTFQDTANSEAGGGPLKHGWTWVTAAATATPDGISLRLATGEILTGTLDSGDGSFTAAGTGSDGTALTLSGTLLFGSLTGTLTWLEPGGASGTSDYALAFPNTATATLSGTYVGPTDDQFDSRGLPLIAKDILLTASQSGQTVTLTDAVLGTRMTGTLAGDVFVAVGTGLTVYGHVTATDASGGVQAFEATYAWSDSSGWGWGELDSGRSSGAVGVSTGSTTWDLIATSSSGGSVPLSTTIAVSSFGNKITVTTTDPTLVKHIMIGKIYRNPDGLASTFVAKDTVETVYGALNASAVTGTYENDTPGSYDNGTYTGAKH